MTPTLLGHLDFDFTRDIAICDEYPWIGHGHVGWSCLPLRNPTGKMTDIAHQGRGVKDTELFGKTDAFALAVTMVEVMTRRTVTSARVSSLAAGGSIGRHSDKESGQRVHVPISTNDKATQTINGWMYHWKLGEIWSADYSAPHSAANFGTERRIHIVMVMG